MCCVCNVRRTEMDFFFLLIFEMNGGKSLYAKAWYFALNNRGETDTPDYEFLRDDRGHPFFLARLLFDAFQRTTGNCARCLHCEAKSLYSCATAGERGCQWLKDALRLRPVATTRRCSLREIIEIPSARDTAWRNVQKNKGRRCLR